MRRVWTGLVLAATAVGLSACGTSGPVTTGRPTAVAAFFPLAATTRALGGPRLLVRDLTPPGVEPHDLELTTNDMDAILDARLVVLMGKGFQPAIESGADRRSGPTLRVLDRLHAGDNPHVWLDPVRMRRVVGEVAGALERAVPAGRAAVPARAERLDASLRALDRDYRTGLAHCARR